MKQLLWTVLLLALLVIVLPLSAQDATATPEKLEFAFDFPITPPTEALIQEAFNCALSRESPEATVTPAAPHKPTGCELAREALALAGSRDQNEQPSEAELALFTKIISANPALALDLSLLAQYYNAVPLVAPPDFASQPITDLSIDYDFGGLGGAANYQIRITNADTNPIVSGEVSASNGYSIATGEPTEAPLELPNTVESSAIQAFGAAVRDLMPIGRQFSARPCWDYYPDWVVDLTFADGTTVKMVTNGSNVVGIGGPWQTEIDGQNYMQYSGAFAGAISGLFDALSLEFGFTAAMGCGDFNNPLEDAFEISTAG